MQVGQRRTLINIEFTRTETDRDPVPMHVVYEMRKVTPFGVLTAAASVDYLTFITAGAEKIDGAMFTQLGTELNRVEMSRVLEMGANSNFGEEVAA